MPSILIYTFFSYSKVTSKGLLKIEDSRYQFDKLFVSNRFATRKLVDSVSKYDYVIGIADHNRNATKSRFDPKYVNRYGKSFIFDDGIELINSNLEISLPDSFYTFSSTTNGPCNRSAYLIMNTIKGNYLNTKFGFFHLCKNSWEEDLKVILGRIQAVSQIGV